MSYTVYECMLYKLNQYQYALKREYKHNLFKTVYASCALDTRIKLCSQLVK